MKKKNQENNLIQLSFVCPMRVERTTYNLGGCRSIQLSYEHSLKKNKTSFNCQE